VKFAVQRATPTDSLNSSIEPCHPSVVVPEFLPPITNEFAVSGMVPVKVLVDSRIPSMKTRSVLPLRTKAQWCQPALSTSVNCVRLPAD
jgi:hypothetical protein